MATSKVRAGGAKWKERTQAATSAYVDGARNPRRSWAAATAASEDAWKAGVQEAAAKNTFSKGVKTAGDAAYQDGITNKGATRFAEGVSVSGDAYDKGFAPYVQVIESTNLPDRGRRGDPKNYQRVQVLGTALNAKKKAIKGQ
jgi:hypothetical protein